MENNTKNENIDTNKECAEEQGQRINSITLDEKLLDALEKKALEEKRRSSAIFGGLTFSFISLIIGFVILAIGGHTLLGSWLFYIFIAIALICFLLSIGFIFDKRGIKTAQVKIDTINKDIELIEIKSGDERILAEKEFKVHQKELKRYYDLNISQIKFLSRLGIILIALGLLIVISSIIAYLTLESDFWFVLLGVVSGVLFDVIGAFFISMYAENMKVAISLHSKLSGSNDLLLANLIVSKIDDKKARNTALAEIAKNISTKAKA